MLLEDPPSIRSGGDEGARFALDKDLVNSDIAGVFEFAQLSAQVAVGDT